ncbi:MAG: radical SAM protein [Myxococcales bacterium]|nr:radical SAM protein [Myxococcales bacterium]
MRSVDAPGDTPGAERGAADPPAVLNIAAIVPCTEAEGPGRRFAIWVQGCPMRCKGCCNPEMLPFAPRDAIPVDELIERACAADVEGVSLLGGEPFAQAGGLARVAEGVRARGLSVMIFTGYTMAELRARAQDDDDARRLLAAADLLVDGRYEARERTTTRRWIGSKNQVLHFLSERYDERDPQFRGDNQVELRLKDGVLTVNGWPLFGARRRLDDGRGGRDV